MNQPMDWRSDTFRQKIRQQMEDFLKRYPPQYNKSIEEIERTVFETAKTKEDYLTYVQKVINHTRLKSQANQQAAQRAAQVNQMQGQSMPPQQQQHGMMRPPMQPGQMSMQMNQNMQQSNQQVMQARQFNNVAMPRGPPSDSPSNMNMQSPLSSGGMSGYGSDRISHPSPSSQYYRPNMTRSNQPTPTPSAQQPQLKMPDAYINAPPGSTGTYIPNLSPAHPSNSPQVSAMSPALRTPGSVSIAHSPASAEQSLTIAQQPAPAAAAMNTAIEQVKDLAQMEKLKNIRQAEESAYMDKLKQLQKYIEPLSRMINKQEKNSTHLSKMKSLRDILMDSTKRLPIQTLLKCENVLQNWMDDKPMPTPPPSRPDQHMCQPILDAVALFAKSPMLNHTLKRTFGPALQALNGDYYVPLSSRSKRAKLRLLEEDNDDTVESSGGQIKVPNVIQGEIARLGSKFKVTVDQSQSSSCGKLHLICKLDDPNLPAVPPLQIRVPHNYPKEGPEWCQDNPDKEISTEDDISSEENLSEEGIEPGFLTQVKPLMETYINYARERNETISAILTAWEKSIKEAVYRSFKQTVVIPNKQDATNVLPANPSQTAYN